MDSRDVPPSEIQGAPPETAPSSTLDVELATVCVADSIWQDQPDNVAAFVESRLGDLARGRGNLYICLDVSGEVEGHSEIERSLIEVIRDTYATSRGSISFALSEALRAANTHLYESNRQVAREMRRMAGVSAVVLRGSDLYIAQAGPAVVYVEASERLARYPAESDWFVEDAPLIAPQGTASAPLGVRREFASDLAHTSVRAADVFVLATRALTQLVTTEELAIAFTERSAQEIASYMEGLGEDSDFTALIAELVDPHSALEELDDEDELSELEGEHIESLPIPLTSLVPLDESEPAVETPVDENDLEWEPASATAPRAQAAPAAQDEAELNWEEPEAETPPAREAAPAEPEFQPVHSAAVAARPLRVVPTGPTPSMPGPTTPPDYAAEIERRRIERAAQRAAQKEGLGRAVGSVAGGAASVAHAGGSVVARAVGAVDWDALDRRINRALNAGVAALINLFLLTVRLVLPGAPVRAAGLVPRRATSEPVWVKALALALPFLLIALAGGRFMMEVGNQSSRVDALVAQAETLRQQADANPDKAQAREQLNRAIQIVEQARQISDTPSARGVLNRIHDQLDEIDGVALLRTLTPLAQINGAALGQIAVTDQDVFMLDGRGRIYQFSVDDVTGKASPAGTDGTILKTGDKAGGVTVGKIELLASATRGTDTATIVAVSDGTLLAYTPSTKQWTAQALTDADTWGDLRAVAGFGGTVYLLDARNNQILKYAPTASGYTPQGVPYFTNARPALGRAVDMAIDGDVWVLGDDGRVQRFRAGVPIQFALAALPVPLNKPTAIFTRPEVDSLYIADAGNQRIVEFDKNGKFVSQFKPTAENGPLFQNLKDFTINEARRKLYFTNAAAAYISNVPK